MADHRDLFDDPRLTTMGLMFEAYEGIVAKLDPIWRAHGMSGLDMNALMRLSRSPGRRLRMSDLATQTRLSTSGVTRLVDRLDRGGLVRRESDPADRRTSYAVLTEAGAQRLAAALPDYLEGVDRWFVSLLPAAGRDDFTAALRTLRDAVNPDATRM
ncbi:MAG: MarR family transcriptional regulator [Mycobacteriaceae bacterium]|nr:MarR family transcriptional regulator [Mycobacteriaceae bacterium]